MDTQDTQEPPSLTLLPFELSFLSAKPDPKSEAPSLAQRFKQWDIADIIARRVKYANLPAPSLQPDAFLLEFMRSQTVQGALGFSLGEVKRVEYKKLSTEYTSMDLFDRLFTTTPSGPIVRENGRVVPRLDEVVQGYTVSDRLRECLLMEDSELWDVFPRADRNEFLFHLFCFVALGGALNQFENTVDPYLEATRAMYKELVSVVRNKATSKIEVTSTVLQVTGMEASSALFPKESANNRCYMIVDAAKKQATVLYYAWKPYW